MTDRSGDSWCDVAPIPETNGDLENILASVDTLRSAWDDALAQVTPEEFGAARRRSLRRHAIETGIIERLYDIDWGVTEALVAEGITAEVVARQGGVDDDALAIIHSQHDALEFLADTAPGSNGPTTSSARMVRSWSTRRPSMSRHRWNSSSASTRSQLPRTRWSAPHGCITGSSGSTPSRTATAGSPGR
jgi:hypothetical protein